jgi:hydroxymethylbilane synthase
MPTKKPFIIVTRTSVLALWQANYVKARIEAQFPELSVELLGVKTLGDKRLDVSLQKIGGKGVFVKELENALYDKSAHIAVHSLKDMPVRLPEGLMIASVCTRENPCDAWVCPKGMTLAELPLNSRVGTSSLRRSTQLKRIRPDLIFEPLRGNIDSRLKKCMDGEWDAIVLAAAGLIRLGLQQHIQHIFDYQTVLPAVSQGALGIECRSDDHETQAILSFLNDDDTRACIDAERAMNLMLGGNCEVPVAGFAQINQQEITLIGRVLSSIDNSMIEAQAKGPIADAEKIGQSVATNLINQGAKEIIAQMLAINRA